MNRTKSLAAVGALVLPLLWGIESGSIGQARAEGGRQSTPDDLFYSYYVPPAGANGVGAELYLCPRPTPPMVGHTYITYQPLAPHEFLYRHSRTYKTPHEDAPTTTTRVHWGYGWIPVSRSQNYEAVFDIRVGSGAAVR
jgi:hypothetical protein